MKMTLLQMVQSILSGLSSDEVNSYSDTTESMQVAEIVRQTYFNMVSRADLPIEEKLFQLTSSTDPTLPVIMYRPEEITKISWIKYYNVGSNNSGDSSTFIHDLDLDIETTTDIEPAPPAFDYVRILPVEDFIDMINGFNNQEDDVVPYSFNDGISSFNFLYKNDKMPQYCTVIKNYYILFDSFDSSVDSTLQSSKTMCYGETIPVFQMADNFIPDLDDYQFPLLLNEAKSLAFLELKQTVHQKAEQETKRQWSTIQKNKSLVNKPSYFDQLPNFGRTGTGNLYTNGRSNRWH